MSEQYHIPIDTNICSGCHLNSFLSKHEVTNAKCCRWCSNISYLHPAAIEAYKKDPSFQNTRVYCKKLGLLVGNTEICKYFEGDK